MDTLGAILKNARQEKKLILRKVSAAVDIDQSLICKFEKDERKPTLEQLIRLSKFYDLSEDELKIFWYSEKIVEEIKYTEAPSRILKIAEEKINYFKTLKNE